MRQRWRPSRRRVRASAWHLGCGLLLSAGAYLWLTGAALAQTTDSAQTGSAWSPYLAGALIGLLSMFTIYVANRPLGASSSYATLGGLVGRKLFPRVMERLPYFRDNPPKIDWEVMVVLGIVIGGFLAAWTGGELTGQWVQPLWEQRFGDTPWLRAIVAFAGGVLMSFGARLAGGCTSGHGISGALHLSVGSWVALTCFFVGGVAVAMPLYRS